jgi:pantoate--beta-alanine ligase
MGALHRGHASLVERCRAENEVAVVSIFVNPAQFNDPADLVRYPRTLDEDVEILRNLGVDHILLPAEQDIYPQGYRFHLELEPTLQVLEGDRRPGFLQGVLTVVLKLLQLVRPCRAYFGEKDYQQLMVVTEMARDFFLPVQIVPCPTVREESGLAMSSRNRLLSSEARDQAADLFHVLTTSAGPGQARAALESRGFVVDYVEERWERRLAAAFLDGVRLIDNVPLAAVAPRAREVHS